jgi:hypothetical protein
MKKVRLTLLIYNYLFVVIVLIAAVLTKNNKNVILPGILLFPVAFYFALSLTDKFTKFSEKHVVSSFHGIKNVLKVYSFVITTLVFLAGFIFARGPVEYFFVSLLAPLPIYFISTWWKSRTMRIIIFLIKMPFRRRRRKKAVQSAKVGTNKPSHHKNAKPPTKKAHPVTAKPKPVYTGKPMVSVESLDSDSAESANTTEAQSHNNNTNTSSKTEEGEVILDAEILNDDHALINEVSGEEVDGDNFSTQGIKDVDRRQFLKLLGGSSLGIIAMTMFFPQKASAAFFGSVPGPGVVAIKDSSGNQIDPAEKGPTDGYRVSEIDDASTPSYYGFVDKDSNWYIAKEDSSGSYRYVKGDSSFSTNWTNRASLSYDYFDTIF